MLENNNENNQNSEEIQNDLSFETIERNTSENSDTSADGNTSASEILNKNLPKKTSVVSSVIDYAEIFVFAICVVILIFSFVFRLCIVVGPSMENTLFEKELLIVSDIGYEPQRGDIVVFHQTGYLNEPVVKRVIAVGGETIDIDFYTWTVTITDKDGTTFVYEEPYMYLDESVARVTSAYDFPYYVPEGSLFVMGDNRNHSSDSRGTLIGLVDERRLLGKVILRVTPFDKFGAVE